MSQCSLNHPKPSDYFLIYIDIQHTCKSFKYKFIRISYIEVYFAYKKSLFRISYIKLYKDECTHQLNFFVIIAQFLSLKTIQSNTQGNALQPAT